MHQFSLEIIIEKRRSALLFIGVSVILFLFLFTERNLAAAETNTETGLSATQSQSREYDSNLPLVFQFSEPTETPPPPEPADRLLFCSNPSRNIPDNNKEGIKDTITIPSSGFIGDLNVRVDIDHTWTGDLVIDLSHGDSGKSISLIDRPGYPADNNGCREDDIKTILDDDITLPVDTECATVPSAISGIYQPENALSTFDNDQITGDWIISVSDIIPYDEGRLYQWCIAAEIYETPIPPPNPPPPDPLPKQVNIPGVTGQSQALPLDCEARSAVDWARFFGKTINEIEFFHDLPESDNPDLGFVGNVYGTWGQIPPYPYGVHAEPVAELLREHGLSAYAHRPLTWDALRAEVAAGKPVITWIVGSYNPATLDNGIPEYYTPQEGPFTVVTRFEHTVIVTGYSPDSVTFLNGGSIYNLSLKQFLESWSALGNMAITSQP